MKREKMHCTDYKRKANVVHLGTRNCKSKTKHLGKSQRCRGGALLYTRLLMGKPSQALSVCVCVCLPLCRQLLELLVTVTLAACLTFSHLCSK